MNLRRLVKQVQRCRHDPDPEGFPWNFLFDRPCDPLPDWFVERFGDMLADGRNDPDPVEELIRRAVEEANP